MEFDKLAAVGFKQNFDLNPGLDDDHIHDLSR